MTIQVVRRTLVTSVALSIALSVGGLAAKQAAPASTQRLDQEYAKRIKDNTPDSRILILTSSTEDEDVRTAVVSGVHGYLTKHAERDEILEAVRVVAGGELWLDRTAQRALGIAAYPDPKVP